MQETKLKKLRVSHNLKAVQIAKAAKIDRSTYSLLECGWTPISIDYGRRLVKGYAKLNIRIKYEDIK